MLSDLNLYSDVFSSLDNLTKKKESDKRHSQLFLERQRVNVFDSCFSVLKVGHWEFIVK